MRLLGYVQFSIYSSKGFLFIIANGFYLQQQMISIYRSKQFLFIEVNSFYLQQQTVSIYSSKPFLFIVANDFYLQFLFMVVNVFLFIVANDFYLQQQGFLFIVVNGYMNKLLIKQYYSPISLGCFDTNTKGIKQRNKLSICLFQSATHQFLWNVLINLVAL